jgi:hypothetical protein
MFQTRTLPSSWLAGVGLIRTDLDWIENLQKFVRIGYKRSQIGSVFW